MRVLGFIPARSGSKGVIDKNVKKLSGKPLIYYTIKAALDAQAQNILTDVIVSTDSESYLSLAHSYGVKADYLRPAELALDTSPTLDCVLHCLDWFEGHKSTSFDAVMILQPTSPFRLPSDIGQAVKLMSDNPEATCVASVSSLGDHHPFRIKKIEDGLLVDFCSDFHEPEPSRRQDFKPDAYIRNGAIYLTKVETLVKDGLIRGDNVVPLIMPEANSVNVDTHFDFVTASAALEYRDYDEFLNYFKD